MTHWYRRLPDRFAAELSLLKAATNAVPKWQCGTLIADEDISIGRYRFGLRIRFPEDFPNQPPVFLLRYPDVPNVEEVHKYRNGELCLLAPSEWTPRMSAAGLRARAIAWMHCLINFMETGTFVQPTRPRIHRS